MQLLGIHLALKSSPLSPLLTLNSHSGFSPTNCRVWETGVKGRWVSLLTTSIFETSSNKSAVGRRPAGRSMSQNLKRLRQRRRVAGLSFSSFRDTKHLVFDGVGSGTREKELELLSETVWDGLVFRRAGETFTFLHTQTFSRDLSKYFKCCSFFFFAMTKNAAL